MKPQPETRDKQYKSHAIVQEPSAKNLRSGVQSKSIRLRRRNEGEGDIIIVDDNIPVTENGTYTTDS